MSTGVYWCKNCHMYLQMSKCPICNTETLYCSSDLRPVFDEEREMYERFLGIKLPNNVFRNRNRIIHEGKTLFRFKVEKDRLLPREDLGLIESRMDDTQSVSHYDQVLTEPNKEYLADKEMEAIKFILSVEKEYSDHSKFISFSGGKDSIVTAILTRKAIGDIPFFFSDTTLEYPETYRFIEMFARKYRFPLFTEKSTQDFFQLCGELGPPSLTFRWCCTVFKAYPVNKFYKTIDGSVITFDGIRKSESHSRRKYSQISRVNKIPRQIATYPIIDWSELDVWLFILFNKLDFNSLYTQGHTRIGCWVCPAAGPSNCFVRRYTHPQLWSKFEKILYNHAEKTGKGKEWVEKNYWRLRRPKKDKDFAVSVEKYKICSQSSMFVYKFKEKISKNLLEFFKPFGPVRVIDAGVQSFIAGSRNPVTITGAIGKNEVRVNFIADHFSREKQLIEQQIRKAMNCVACGGCVGICPQNAISIVENKFHIDSWKCNHCKTCVEKKFIPNGCVALNYISTRKEIKGGG
jgi:phosphoadenosine phosphosulfate reductase